MPHSDELLGLLVAHTRRTDNPHVTTGAQLGLGALQSASGTATGAASGVAQTLFAMPGATNAAYLVACDVASASPNTYSAVALITTDAGVARITNIQTATLMVIGVSGLNIQATQSSGAVQSFPWTVTRIS